MLKRGSNSDKGYLIMVGYTVVGFVLGYTFARFGWRGFLPKSKGFFVSLLVVLVFFGSFIYYLYNA